MSSAARVTRPPPAPDPTLHGRAVQRFTVEQYHRMIDAGVFDGAGKCELIHGLILEKAVPGPPHSKSTSRVNRLLSPLFPYPDWFVQIQDSITLADSEPEPDFSAATDPESKYDARHPGPKDLVLVVEVSHTTAGFDRGTKLALYAENKVVQYWIIDIEKQCVEVYTDPRGGKAPGYRSRAEYAPGADIPVVVAGRTVGTVPAAELLP